MSLLTGEPRSATVRAKRDARLLVVEREGFESLFRARPSIAEAISRTLATRLSELRERRAAAVDTAEGRSRTLLAKMRTIFGF
jgi:CRP-like cAMP-binding protein